MVLKEAAEGLYLILYRGRFYINSRVRCIGEIAAFYT
jgi:hypothetical protein